MSPCHRVTRTICRILPGIYTCNRYVTVMYSLLTVVSSHEPPLHILRNNVNHVNMKTERNTTKVKVKCTSLAALTTFLSLIRTFLSQ